MCAAEAQQIPAWAERERTYDLAWIGENLSVLWPAAQAGYEEYGRGALLVDTTSRPTGAGHPFFYGELEIVQEGGDQDAIRIVQEYEPSWEMVTVLFKAHERVSTYRIGVLPREGRE